MSQILIRPAVPSLASLLALIHTESFGAEGWSTEQMRGSLGLATTEGDVAFESATPVGFILCQTTPDECEILTFCVRPVLRRRGIGEQLLRYAIDQARTQDRGKIFLEVAADNIAARALYEKLGFTIAGTRPGYYKRGAVTVDGIRYQKSENRDRASDG
ncbi:MAG TPA: ribosomal protein S18-alanine N-acetyltransferase [Alphaproteobacteria bacterium]|nr:ribosomal protein S18-alanine N-acetyltransferase [Alphaproteobacteria bacterium]